MKKSLGPYTFLTINLHPSDSVFVPECDLPPGRAVVTADVAGETVSVHPQGGMMGFPVFSVPGEVADSFLSHNVCNSP